MISKIHISLISFLTAFLTAMFWAGMPSPSRAATAEFDFGPVSLGSVKTTTVSVFNYDSVDANITGFNFLPDNCSDFSVDSSLVEKSIPAGGKIEFEIKYAPSTEGECLNVFIIWTDGSDFANFIGLSGNGVLQTPADMINEILNNFDSWVGGEDPGESTVNEKQALLNMLEVAARHIEYERYSEAVQKLSVIRRMLDAGSEPVDFLTNESAADLSSSIDKLIEALNSKIQDQEFGVLKGHMINSKRF